MNLMKLLILVLTVNTPICVISNFFYKNVQLNCTTNVVCKTTACICFVSLRKHLTNYKLTQKSKKLTGKYKMICKSKITEKDD